MNRFVESTITFPYRRSLGPITGAFMTALTEKKILGIRHQDAVIVPPMEWDPQTGDPTGNELVEVGPAGTVESWTWVPNPSEQHPLDRPFGFAHIRLDGATTPLLHAVDAGSSSAMSNGMRVAPRWRGTRVGRINDIVSFVPGEDSEIDGEDTGPPGEAIEIMNYDARITYRNPVPSFTDRTIEASREHRIVGQKCPICERVYVGGRGICPIDSLELTEEHEVDVPSTGTVTNFLTVTPTPYPGQTETEPFARVFVLLDGTDVVLGYQPVIEFPVADVKIGTRVVAVWASPAEAEADEVGHGLGHLLGWMPSGEPDIDDPELVNRIF